jgi:hypothetical protein
MISIHKIYSICQDVSAVGADILSGHVFQVPAILRFSNKFPLIMYIFSINDVMGACPQTVGKSNLKYKAPMGKYQNIQGR